VVFPFFLPVQVRDQELLLGCSFLFFLEGLHSAALLCSVVNRLVCLLLRINAAGNAGKLEGLP